MRVGDNHLGYGTFQLFKYANLLESRDDGFSGEGSINKIEAGISASNSYGTSTDYPEKERITKEVVVAGQPAIRFEVELSGGQKILSYSILLPTMIDKYLSIVIYGDSSNFHILDEIVKSIEWMR